MVSYFEVENKNHFSDFLNDGKETSMLIFSEI